MLPPAAPALQLVVTCEVCRRPATKECWTCGMQICEFCTLKRHWKVGGRGRGGDSGRCATFVTHGLRLRLCATRPHVARGGGSPSVCSMPAKHRGCAPLFPSPAGPLPAALAPGQQGAHAGEAGAEGAGGEAGGRRSAARPRGPQLPVSARWPSKLAASTCTSDPNPQPLRPVSCY
jgi:hypothetical protein